MMTRTVIVDRRQLEQLLSDRLWSVEEFASACECHPKTVERAMRGTPVLRSTVRRMAAALKVPPQMLLGWEEPDERGPSQVIEFVIRGHRPVLERSRVFLDFIRLLTDLLGQAGEVQFRACEAGRVRFAVSPRGAAELVSRFDGFEEYAFELIRGTEDGSTYLRGEPLPSVRAERVRGLVELVGAVAELRLPAPDAAERTAGDPSATPAPSAGDGPPSYGPLLPPDVPACNTFLQTDKGELVRLYGEALSAPPGPERDYRLLKIAEAMEYAEAVERHESLPRNG
jgi:hypothetical protein